jgi:hypothetical protein
MRTIELSRIRVDGGTQPRAAIDQATVDEYAESMGRLDRFPPPVVYYDGANIWLADGFHRFHAARKAGVQAVEVDWREGTLEMAKLYAASANKAHGLKRTPGDKRRAIEMVLSTEEGRRWSQEQIAKHCGVGPSYVREVMGKSADRGSPHPSTHEGKRAAVAAAVGASPAASDSEIARKTGVDRKTVAKVRADHEPESASPPPSPPRLTPSYASTAERDTAGAILAALRSARGNFKDPSWSLLLHQMAEIIHVRTPED